MPAFFRIPRSTNDNSAENSTQLFEHPKKIIHKRFPFEISIIPINCNAKVAKEAKKIKVYLKQSLQTFQPEGHINYQTRVPKRKLRMRNKIVVSELRV